MNPYLIITGLCCSVIVSGLIPIFASPKVVVENKMKTNKQDWSKRNPIQSEWKKAAQLKEMKEMEEKIRQEQEQEQANQSEIGQKRKRKRKRQTKKKKSKRKTKNKSKRK